MALRNSIAASCKFPLFEIALTALKIFLLAGVGITRACRKESGNQGQE